MVPGERYTHTLAVRSQMTQTPDTLHFKGADRIETGPKARRGRGWDKEPDSREMSHGLAALVNSSLLGLGLLFAG